jgi:hypothetical protein
MQINTAKIKAEMDRLGLTYRDIGNRMRPRLGSQAVWYLVHHACNLNSIDKIARALDMNGRDLIK